MKVTVNYLHSAVYTVPLTGVSPAAFIANGNAARS